MPYPKFFFERLALGQRLKRAREAAGLTQEDVRNRTGYQQAFLSKTETGQRRPDAWEVAELARLYNVSLDELLKPLTPDEEAEKVEYERRLALQAADRRERRDDYDDDDY